MPKSAVAVKSIPASTRPSKGHSEEEEQKGAIPLWTTVKLLRKSDLRTLLYQRQTAAAKIKLLEQELKGDEKTGEIGLNDQILALLMGAKVQKIVVDDMTVTRATGHTATRINKGILLDHGVDPEAIEAATEGGDAYPYLTVTVPKGKGNSDE